MLAAASKWSGSLNTMWLAVRKRPRHDVPSEHGIQRDGWPLRAAGWAAGAAGRVRCYRSGLLFAENCELTLYSSVSCDGSERF
jgi:hypothetical protein